MIGTASLATLIALLLGARGPQAAPATDSYASDGVRGESGTTSIPEEEDVGAHAVSSVVSDVPPPHQVARGRQVAPPPAPTPPRQQQQQQQPTWQASPLASLTPGGGLYGERHLWDTVWCSAAVIAPGWLRWWWIAFCWLSHTVGLRAHCTVLH